MNQTKRTYDKTSDKVYDSLQAALNKIARLESALTLIATPMRTDGTYNRDRTACGILAREALK